MIRPDELKEGPLPDRASRGGPTAPLSVTHVTAPATMGGLESVVAGLARGMAERGHRVRVIALLDSRPSCIPFAALPEAGVELVEIRIERRTPGAESRRIAAELGRAPGVVHTHGARADRTAYFAARSSGSPLLATSHGYLGGGRKNRLAEWLDRRLLARFDRVVAVSRPLGRLLERAGVRSERLRIIPNARHSVIHLDRAGARALLGLGADELVCGWVGRLSSEKGPDVMIEALARLPAPWRLSVIGTGPLEDVLRARAGELGLADRVRWHGPVVDAARVLPAFDAFALSSRTEGSPMVVLEAMAARVPLVLAEVGGVPEMVGPGEAVLVPPDDPGALAAGITSVSPTAPAVRAMVESAFQVSQGEYSVHRWLDRYQSLYHELASGKAGAA